MKIWNKILSLFLMTALLLSAYSCGIFGLCENAAEASSSLNGTAAGTLEKAVPSGETENDLPGNDPVGSRNVSEMKQQEAVLKFEDHRGNTSGEYTDAVGNLYTYSYALPFVSGGTDYIKIVNGELDDIYDTYIAPELLHMASGNSLVTTYVSWRTAEYNGIISLIVCLYNDWDSSAYRVFNFTSEGEKAAKENIFASLGFGGEEFRSAAFETLSEYLGCCRENDKTEEAKKLEESMLEKTLSPENCSADLPIYITSWGTVCFVGRVYTVAGAGYYDHLFVIVPQNGFSAEELAELACDYCGIKSGCRPEAATVQMNEDGTVTLQMYERSNDYNSICASYTVSPENGKGVDSDNAEINLTVQ